MVQEVDHWHIMNLLRINEFSCYDETVSFSSLGA
jgi:hypothetical protein